MIKQKKVAIAAAKKAGLALLKQFNNFDRGKVKLKSAHEIVTSADLSAEKIILSELRKNFPLDQIISEEAGTLKGKSDYFWIVDPLDGTTNFSIHSPFWAVSIGLAYKKELMLAVILAPFFNELYVAEKGKGAYLYKYFKFTAKGEKMKVSKINSEKMINIFCHGKKISDIKRAIRYYGQQKLNGFDCRQLGSASLELAWVAGGRAESFFIPGADLWDVAPGVLLVREAGGKVTDAAGKEWNLDSYDIIASNGKTHKEVLKVVKRL
ncbi:MAG: inositol monophosphatase family protein [Patescibacteria group bacterium]|nr:inositol monophosphatase family protein [Patescibacteria group bacterium]MDD4610922.1 inositol monophosphatase family protein [Patescibacteria group bacterium]